MSETVFQWVVAIGVVGIALEIRGLRPLVAELLGEIRLLRRGIHD